MCWAIRRFVLVSLSVVMIQSGITTGQQQPNNAGFVHPIATDTFPVNRPTATAGPATAGPATAAAEAAEQQPAEETPTSTEPAVQTSAPVKQPPMFQVPVTLPFVMQGPQTPSNAKPASYLRPVGVMVDPIISQDEPAQQSPVRQTKPWYANLPQEEDLSSAPGVAVTLPFRTKPASYLRPVFVMVDEINDDEPVAQDVQPAAAVQQTKPYHFPTRNVAVTLPFNLRPASSKSGGNRASPSEHKILPVIRSKPLSYLRPAVVLADADGALAATPEGDYYNYAPAEEDFTSPISAAVQPSPPRQAVMAIPLVRPPVKAQTKPASYLRPWLVDDVATPVRATKPWRPQEVAAADDDDDDDDSAGHDYQRPPVFWPLAYRAASPAVNSVRPWVHRRPITVLALVTFHVRQPPSVGVWLQFRPPIIARNLLLAVEEQRLLEPIKDDHLPLPVQNGAAQQQQLLLVRPLIALPVERNNRHPIKAKRPATGPVLLPTVPDVQSSIAGAGQQQARVPFLGNWANNNNNNNNNNLLEKTHVVGGSTLVYTKHNVLMQTGTSTVYASTVFTATTTVRNAYCYTSANAAGLLAPSPWCSFRRKRSAHQEQDESAILLSIDGQQFQPSRVQKMLMTAVPSAPDSDQAIDSSITFTTAEDVAKVSGRRFLNLATNRMTARPPPPTTTTVTLTSLTFVTEIAITSTTRITFAAGQCVPRCLQDLPVCGR